MFEATERDVIVGPFASPLENGATHIDGTHFTRVHSYTDSGLAALSDGHFNSFLSSSQSVLLLSFSPLFCIKVPNGDGVASGKSWFDLMWVPAI